MRRRQFGSHLLFAHFLNYTVWYIVCNGAQGGAKGAGMRRWTGNAMRWLTGIGLIGSLAAAGYAWLSLAPPGKTEKPVSVSASSPSNAIAVEVKPVKLGVVQRELEAVGSLRSNEFGDRTSGNRRAHHRDPL